MNPNVALLGSILPYHLNVELPVLIVGDELPLGAVEPEELTSDAGENLPSDPENVCVTVWV